MKSETTEKHLSIIIVTYNSSSHIYDCLDSIFKYNDLGDNLETIVVDNDSQEQQSMFEGIREKYGDKVVTIDSGKNGGYGFGNNVGISKASAPIVIVMNPDVRLVRPVFKIILEEIGDECVGMLGGSFVDGSNPYYVKYEYVNIWNQIFHPLAIFFKRYNEKTMYMSGSFLVFVKDVFINAGAFDENIFMYCEEPDITNRIQNLNYHAKWCDEIKVKHLAHGRSFNKKTEFIQRESLKYYFRKYNSNLANNIKVKIKIYKIKRMISILINNKSKQDLFTNLLHSHQEFLDSITKQSD
jgi:GT2 family glycosyltransferase